MIGVKRPPWIEVIGGGDFGTELDTAGSRIAK